MQKAEAKQSWEFESAEWYKALADELNAKPSDPAATDKSNIEQELR
ncbi:hypothetical protein V501_00351, partial [Pseudogymnoascus sp. VKM F-4519 (FW-2642)]